MVEFLIWFLIFWIFHGLSVTLGYHRILGHKSATKVNKVLYYSLVWGAYTALQGTPISWVGAHRRHHQVTDTIFDPHTPLKGFFYSFNGWIWDKSKPSYDYLVSDLMKDPILRFFGHGPLPSKSFLNVSCCILWRVFIYFLLGPMAALASLCAGVAIFFAPQLINTLCHMPALGYRTYPTRDLSTNIHWLNTLTFGEAYHNNHHAFPSRIYQGELARKEVDTTYLFALLFRKLGLMEF